MDSKKVIEKLVKIAENQQKIINKLAQQAGMVPQGGSAQPTGGASDNWDPSAQLAGVLAQIPEAVKAKAGIQSASFRQGFLDVKVKFPSVKQMGDPTATAALNKFRAAVKQLALKDPNGKPANVTQENVVGVYG